MKWISIGILPNSDATRLELCLAIIDGHEKRGIRVTPFPRQNININWLHEDQGVESVRAQIRKIQNQVQVAVIGWVKWINPVALNSTIEKILQDGIPVLPICRQYIPWKKTICSSDPRDLDELIKLIGEYYKWKSWENINFFYIPDRLVAIIGHMSQEEREIFGRQLCVYLNSKFGRPMNNITLKTDTLNRPPFSSIAAGLYADMLDKKSGKIDPTFITPLYNTEGSFDA